MSAEKGSNIESTATSTKKEGILSSTARRSKEAARSMGRKFKEFKGSAAAGLRRIAGFKKEYSQLPDNSIQKDPYKGSRKRRKKALGKNRRLSNLTYWSNREETPPKVDRKPEGPLAKWAERRKERFLGKKGYERGRERIERVRKKGYKRAGKFIESYKKERQRRNDLGIHKAVSKDRFNQEGRYSKRERSKNTLEHPGRFRIRNRNKLTPAAHKWYKKHTGEVWERWDQLNKSSLSEKGKLSKSQDKKNLRNAIWDSRKAAKEGPLDKLNAIRNSQQFKDKLGEELRKKTGEKGRRLNKREQRRLENNLLAQELKPKKEAAKKPQTSEKKPEAQRGTNREKNKDNELTPEQKAMKNAMILGAELSKLGFDPKSKEGQEFMNKLVKRPKQMEELGKITNRINSSKEKRSTAEEEVTSLKKQINEEKDEKKKGALRTLLRLLGKTLKFAGIATLTTVGVTATIIGSTAEAVSNNN